MDKTSRVLVTDAQSRIGLAIIRSLGRKGVKVTAADSHIISKGFFSRYCSRRLLYPDPSSHPEAYLDVIIRELERGSYDVVIPVDDYSLAPLSKNKEEVEKHARFPFLDYDKLKGGRDKALTIIQAKKCGIKVPETIIIKGEDDIERIQEQLCFPVILRPRVSRGSRGLFKIKDSRELILTYRGALPKYGPMIVQEYIPWGGMNYDVSMIMNKRSEPRAIFVDRAIRIYYGFIGPQVLGEGVEYPELKDLAIRLLQALNWYGPAQIEFRIDPRDQKPTLMEVNSRFWGSLHLGIVSGIDFPYLLYQMAMNGDISPVLDYRKGIKARWLLPGDIMHLIYNPERKRVLISWIKDLFNINIRLYIPARDDPLPVFGALLEILEMLISPNNIKKIAQLLWTRRRNW